MIRPLHTLSPVERARRRHRLDRLTAVACVLVAILNLIVFFGPVAAQAVRP